MEATWEDHPRTTAAPVDSAPTPSLSPRETMKAATTTLGRNRDDEHLVVEDAVGTAGCHRAHRVEGGDDSDREWGGNAGTSGLTGGRR